MIGVRLDDLVESFGLPVPTHAKIDTDGYELEVLRGAERTLTRSEWKTVIVEFERGETRRNREIKKVLARAGFDAGREHLRLASANFPGPDGRPDVYWTFEKNPGESSGRRRVSSRQLGTQPTRHEVGRSARIKKTVGRRWQSFRSLVRS